ncbi:28S ribosomal protein S10, mitochondrial [Trichinella sp. T9]|nr:28S ribosomal protein S10, mitochondrial [Trichinella sp. T9]
MSPWTPAMPALTPSDPWTPLLELLLSCIPSSSAMLRRQVQRVFRFSLLDKCSVLQSRYCGPALLSNDQVRNVRMTREEVLHRRMDVIPKYETPAAHYPYLIDLVDEEPVTKSLEKDILYKSIEIRTMGHDRAVLASYETFALTAARHLQISVEEAGELKPPYVLWRRTLVRSAHVHKNTRVQYETRTYRRSFRIIHLTGSTADTYLEYIQRNLPEGVGMEVIKKQLSRLPTHIKAPLQNTSSLNEPNEV